MRCLERHAQRPIPSTERWSRVTGQNGGLAKVGSGFVYAANFCSRLRSIGLVGRLAAKDRVGSIGVVVADPTFDPDSCLTAGLEGLEEDAVRLHQFREPGGCEGFFVNYPPSPTVSVRKRFALRLAFSDPALVILKVLKRTGIHLKRSFGIECGLFRRS